MVNLSNLGIEKILKTDEKIYATDKCCANCDSCEQVHGADSCLCYVWDKMMDIRSTCDCFTKRQDW